MSAVATATRVIVVGLDGLEPSIVEPMVQAGELPELARLRARGSYCRLATTTPAQTPVAWSTFATGVNPGGHGIFDFLRRDPQSYLPDLALNRYEQPGPLQAPRAVNLRRGVPLWEVLSGHGVSSTILRCPCTYPPDALRGRLLAGMGVPDLRGGLGTATLLTTDPNVAPRESEQVVSLLRDGNGWRGALIGPRQHRQRRDATTPITLHVQLADRAATVAWDGTPARVDLRVGEWSPWLRVSFRVGLLTRVAAAVRMILLRVEPHVELYVSPANFDPHDPLYPISHPAGYSAELAGALGGYYTTGMVEDHAGLSNGRLSEEQFLAQCDDAMRERTAMFRHELHRQREGLLFVLYDTPDRVQHMFWRFREPGHPANREDPAQLRRYARVIEEHYRRCDAVVGEALRAADDETLVLALSDHGFTSFHRGVHLNNWLHDAGLLTLRGGGPPRAESGDFLREVDWGRTQAYALGMGSIYLNVAGRERDGIVAPADAEALATRIAREVTGLRDAEHGGVAVLGGRTRRELYHGPYAEESPDVVVLFNAGYRVSWSTALGGFGDRLIEDNTRRWGGDHLVDPALVPGVLFSSRPLDAERISMVDLAPTILAALGVPVPPVMEGRPRLAGPSHGAEHAPT